MANTLFDKSRKRFLEGQINWMSATVKAMLIDTGTYTPNFANHDTLADVSVGARITPGITLVDKDTTGGAADARDVTFTSVTGPSIEAILLYIDGGSGDASCPLIAFIDTGTGLPITPNGGDIIVTWDNGPNKIFKV